MRITKQQITSAIDRANLSHDSWGCDRCWLNHLETMLGIGVVEHPCSYAKELLNKQYHTNYKITPGSCNVRTFPTAEILSKLNVRAVKI